MQPQRLAVLTLALLALMQPVSAQTLKGSRDSMQRQYQLAVSYGYSFLKTPAAVNNLIENGYLVKVSPSRTMELHAVSYPYARPEVKLFVERLSEQYLNACGEKMTVTSLTRPINLQPANASEASVHPTGMAVDLRVPSNGKCRQWLESTLLSLEGTGVLDVTREYYPPHFHVAVYTKIYGNYVASLDAGQQMAGNTEYVVQRGDTLSRIADRTGAPLPALRAANALRSDLIRVGQKLQIPGTTTLAPDTQLASNRSPAPIRESEASSDLPVQAVAAVAVRNAASSERGNGSYVVKRGDSLARIADRTGTSVAELRRSNGLRGNMIHPGQTLQIPGQVAVEPLPQVVAQADIQPAEVQEAQAVTQVQVATVPLPEEVQAFIDGTPSHDAELVQAVVVTAQAVPQSAEYVVRRGDSLATIAGRNHLTVAELRKLNGLRGSVIYPGQTLKLLDQSTPSAALLATVPQLEESIDNMVMAVGSARPADYVVRRGDSLATIAQHHQLSIDELRQFNNLRGNLIYPGQTLRLAEVVDTTLSVVGASASTTDATEALSEYVVRKGDTLSIIATRTGTDILALRQVNGLRNDVIQIGQTLTIPGQIDGDMLAVEHEVRRGESLWRIANRYGTTVSDLRQANALSNDSLTVGQILRVNVALSN